MKKMTNEIRQNVAETQNDSFKSGSMQYIDSREVAEMVEKNHRDLMRDIRRYCKQMEEFNQRNTAPVDINQRNLALSDFFMESTYIDGKGERRSCYLVTQKGCEFIAHKLTGKKGSIFTATYINRFHEMKGELADGAGAVEALVNTIKEYMLYQENRSDKQIELLRQQMEFSQEIMDRLEKLEKGAAGHPGNPYCAADNGRVEGRKQELYEVTSKVAELCGSSHTKILHYMYRTLEEDLGIVLDSYKSVYRMETGRQDAGMMEVIAANDQIFEKAMEMNNAVIERKQIYG